MSGSGREPYDPGLVLGVIRLGVISQAEAEISDIILRVERHCLGETVVGISIDPNAIPTEVTLHLAKDEPWPTRK